MNNFSTTPLQFRQGDAILFPADAIPLQILNPLREAADKAQVPIEMSFSALMAAASLACQSVAVVEKLPGLVSPLSTAFGTNAPPTARKSSVDVLFTKPIEDFEAEICVRYQEELDQHKKLQRRLNQGEQLIGREMNKRLLNSEDISDLEEQHAAIQKQRSPAPLVPSFIVNAATQIAMIKSIDRWPNKLASATEGSIFDSDLFTAPGLINNYHDGKNTKVERFHATYGTSVPTLSLNISVQDHVWQRFFNRRDGQAMETGFTQRILYAKIEHIPPRFLTKAPPQSDHIAVLNERIKAVLSLSLPAPGAALRPKHTLVFSKEAQARWNDLYNFFEAGRLPGGPFESVPAAAARTPDHIARIAAIFHIICGALEAEIQVQMVEAAAAVAYFYLRHFLAEFGPGSQHDPLKEDVFKLEQYFLGRLRKNYCAVDHKFSDLLNLRRLADLSKGNRLDNALAKLQVDGALSMRGSGLHRGINLSAPYFANL